MKRRLTCGTTPHRRWYEPLFSITGSQVSNSFWSAVATVPFTNTMLPSRSPGSSWSAVPPNALNATVIAAATAHPVDQRIACPSLLRGRAPVNDGRRVECAGGGDRYPPEQGEGGGAGDGRRVDPVDAPGRAAAPCRWSCGPCAVRWRPAVRW